MIKSGFDFRKTNDLGADSALAGNANSVRGRQSPQVDLGINSTVLEFENTNYNNHQVDAQIGFSKWLWGFFNRHFLFLVFYILTFVGFALLAKYKTEYRIFLYSVDGLLFAGGGFAILVEYQKFLFRKSLKYANIAADKNFAQYSNKIKSFLGKLAKSISIVEKEKAAQIQDLRGEFAICNAKFKDSYDLIRTRLNRLQNELHSEFVNGDRQLLKEFSRKIIELESEFVRNEKWEESERAIISLDGRLQKLLNADFESKINSWSKKIQSTKIELEDQIENQKSVVLRELDDKVDKEKEIIDARFTQCNDKVKGLESLTSKAIGKLNSVNELDNKLGKVASSSEEINRYFNLLTTSNSACSQVHQRFLMKSDVNRLFDHWIPLLNLEISKRAISYLAHRICQIEDQLDGRLATTISAAVLRVLALKSIKRKKVSVLEIGTLFGVSSCMLKALGRSDQSQVHVTVIDPLTGYYKKGTLDPQTGVPVDRDTLEKNFRSMGFEDSEIRIIEKFSQDKEAVSAAKQRMYDYVILDGDHSYDGLAKDFELYSGFVRPGGLLVFDDYDTPEWPDIKRVVVDKVQGDKRWEWLGGEWRTGIFRRAS